MPTTNLGALLALAWRPVPVPVVLGTCPVCHKPVTDKGEPPEWTCPADLPDDNPWQEYTHPDITEALREQNGVFSNCGEDFGLPCHDPLPVHDACYQKGY